MLAIIVAMKKEADALLCSAAVKNECTLYGKPVIRGSAFGKDFTLLLSGVGKSNAAAAAMLAATLPETDAFLNFGLAGGVPPSAAIGSILRITRAVQYDFDLCETNGTPIGTLDEYAEPSFYLQDGASAFPKALLATGDRMTNSSDSLPLLKQLGAALRDMEGAAIAHVAEFTGLPLWMYKAVSDEIGSGSIEQYTLYQRQALQALAQNMHTIFGEIDG